MDIGKALYQAKTTAGWSTMDIAYSVGATHQAALNWVSSRFCPNARTLEILRVKLPGLSALLDAQAQEFVASEKIRHAA